MSSSIGRKLMKIAMAAVMPAVLVLMMFPTGIKAQEKGQIVRVGWFESPFNTTDELGRRSGYSYDYQQKIAAYTGWTYEYVEGSWSDLLEMLKDGRIDLLSDVSFTEERAEKMLFSALPMGAEQYYLYAQETNNDISVEDYSTIQGKRIGANMGSVQIGYFNAWAEANGVKTELIELSGTEEENILELKRGKIDLYLSLDGFFESSGVKPVCRIGTSDFYFAVSNDRPQLLTELNSALSRIQNEDQYYNENLYQKYLHSAGLNRYLSTEESTWLSRHGVIRVGYQDNYLAFCAKDPKTGELTGALKDYLIVASDCLENAHIDFEAVCYPSSGDAIAALRKGEVDCVFPANLTPYDGEVSNVFITPALMRTDMSAIVREGEQYDFAKKDRITVAVNKDNPNYDMFLLDHFPDWLATYYENTEECLKAIAGRNADCLLISNYRYNNIANTCRKYHLTTWSTGVGMDYCFAVNRSDTILYSILSKVTSLVPASTVNASLTYYFTEDAKISTEEVLKQNFLLVFGGFAMILALLIVLARSIAAGRKEKEVQKKEPAEEDFRIFDDLPISVSVYHVTHAEHSRLYDAEVIYANRMFSELGQRPRQEVIGKKVRELYPHLDEIWYEDVRRAAYEGEVVERDHTDSLSGRAYHFTVRQIVRPGYCVVTYAESMPKE
ncbi:MAG: transporter substrate-binding domain-containing protein [Solobacterium sp.]|nr:transporter substrate-binding domain-containing protein [Solobacterium sp.]